MNDASAKAKEKRNKLDKRTFNHFKDNEVLTSSGLAQQTALLNKMLQKGDEDKRKQASRATPRATANQALGEVLKWIRAITSYTEKTDPPESLSSSTLYVFKQSSRIRIFCINACRSGKYKMTFRIIMLVFYARLTIANFNESEIGPNDPFSIIAGTCMFVNVALHLIAYGFLGHRNSYLLRAPFNFIEFFLTICFFIPEMFFLQVLQLFRLFSFLENLSLANSISSKSSIIRRSLLSLGIFAVIYLILIFLFSLFSYLVFYSEMSMYCVDPSSSSIIYGVEPFDPAFDHQRPLHDYTRLFRRLCLLRLEGRLV